MIAVDEFSSLVH